MATEEVVKCKICGEPYVFMAFYAGDQSACPKCVQKAYENTFGTKNTFTTTGAKPPKTP